MARGLDLDELIEHRTVLEPEWVLVAGKRGATRLGFAVVLKFYTRFGRFPRGRGELAAEAVEFVARQVEVPAGELDSYSWSGRTWEYHRAQIRAHLGFRECTVADADKLAGWLAADVCVTDPRPVAVREALLGRCRAEQIEPPTAGRRDRIVRSALAQAERAATDRITGRLAPETKRRLSALISDVADDEAATGVGVLGSITAAAGNVSLETMLVEIDKLRAVRAVGLPGGLFADTAPVVLAGWRARAAVEDPSHLRSHPEPLRLTLLAALLVARERELTDTLIDLLISTVHRIAARADRKVTEELVNAFRRVTGKENLLFSIAGAALARPDETVRDVVFPAVSGGEGTLRELVQEYKSKGPIYQRTVKTTLRASYTNHYRRGLIRLLDVLEFRCGRADQPVLAALELIRRHAATTGGLQYYPLGETVPLHRGTGGEWEPLVFRTDAAGRRRVVRMTYEIVTFQALRDRLRCKDIWVGGAERWRNPDEDLPADFAERRAEHYAALRKPLDPAAFINQLREEMTDELAALDDALPELDWLEVAERRAGAIKLTPLEAVPEPTNLRRLKKQVAARWGTVALIDLLKEAVLRTGALSAVTSAGTRSDLAPEVLAERLLLVIYGYGTNTGLRAVAAGDHGHTEDDLRYIRRRYLCAETARAIAIQIADATFAARDHTVWGAGSSAVSSDSTHVGAFDQNIFTEWHSRYGGRGILIYWHVERGSMAIHSQHLNCTASEVAAMVEGAIHHGTSMDVEANYTDSHGASEIGFGITRLLGFDLLPRLKRINKTRLYRPAGADPDAYPRLAPALTRPIRWELIADQYDQMIKYATAIRTGTATTEAILRRFTRTAAHPTYQAMLETGRAQKSLFVARYLRRRDLQREINDGLNVGESWNGANSVIRYGKGGELASNRRDEQELSVLCLRVLQAAMVFINTLMVQALLAEQDWSGVLTDADYRGLTPLFWSHVAPYGEVRLDMARRLPLGSADITPTAPEDPSDD